MNNQVSEYDNEIFLKIRNNIDHFIKSQANKLDNENFNLLDIAPQDHAGAIKYFVKSKVYTADINKDSGADYIIDICEDNSNKIESNTFDIIVCTEVLEHTLQPFLAVNEMHRLLKSEGLLLMTTPFDFRIHGPLPDCWRFTVHGLKALLKDFEIVEINGLENKNRFLMPYHYTTIAKKVNK